MPRTHDAAETFIKNHPDGLLKPIVGKLSSRKRPWYETADTAAFFHLSALHNIRYGIYGDTFALQAFNDKYVSYKLSYDARLLADAPYIKTWEIFIFSKAAHSK